MRKRTALVLAVLLCLGASAWAEIELGVGIAPPLGEIPAGASSGNFFNDATKVMHVGYSFLWLFYASYDGLVLPPYSVSQMTSSIDNSNGNFLPGYLRPGFLNTFNVGIRPRIGPVSVMASIGINSLYVYKAAADGLQLPPVGVNLKLGVGMRLAKWFGITATGTSVFSDFQELTSTLDALTGSDTYLKQIAQDRILNNLFPTVCLVLYL
jgi:hypothetical protein